MAEPPWVVGVGARVKVSAGNLASVPLPAGWTATDLLLLLLGSGDNVVATATGYTKKLETNAGVALRQTIAWKYAVPGETAVTVTHAAGDGAIACLVAIRGGPTSGDPFDDAQATATTVPSTTAAAPAVTPARYNALVLMLVNGGVVANTSTTMTVSGYSGDNPVPAEVLDDDVFVGINEVGMALAVGVKADTTSTGARTATLVTSGQSVGTLMSISPPVPTATEQSKTATALPVMRRVKGRR